MKNKYVGRSKLSEAKFRELLKCFCLDLDAGQIAILIRVNRNTVNRYLRLIRERISALTDRESPFGGKMEFHSLLGDSRFHLGQPPPKTIKGTGLVFGAVSREGNVFTEILPGFLQPFLVPVIRGKAELASGLTYTFRFRGYHSIMHLGCKKPLFLDPSSGSSRYPGRGCGSLAGFWFFVKRRIRKFQGLPVSTFGIHLKECQFRFNSRGEDIYTQLLKVLREKPIMKPYPGIPKIGAVKTACQESKMLPCGPVRNSGPGACVSPPHLSMQADPDGSLHTHDPC